MICRVLVRTSPVGTTAEIRSRHGGGASAGEEADGGGLAVMARGRHRFRLVEDLGWRCGARKHGSSRGLGESGELSW